MQLKSERTISQFQLLIVLSIFIFIYSIISKFIDAPLYFIYLEGFLLLIFLKRRTGKKNHIRFGIFLLVFFSTLFYLLYYNHMYLLAAVVCCNVTNILCLLNEIKTVQEKKNVVTSLELNYVLVVTFVLITATTVNFSKLTYIYHDLEYNDVFEYFFFTTVIFGLIYSVGTLIRLAYCDCHEVVGLNQSLMVIDKVKPSLSYNTLPICNENSRKVVEFFESSTLFLDRDFTVDMLAKEIGLTKTQLSETLNKTMGVNFYNLVASYRIKYAKQLLEERHDILIDGIIVNTGFNSKTTFNKYFKHFVGITPTEFRNKVMNNEI